MRVCAISQQDAGSDVTEGQHEECEAEDHGKCSEKRGGDEGGDVTECEAVMRFIIKVI